MHARIICRRIVCWVVAMLAVALLVERVWQAPAVRIGQVPVVLGTAQMQAEVMALAIRQVRPPWPPMLPPPLVVRALSVEEAAAPPPPSLPRTEAAVPAPRTNVATAAGAAPALREVGRWRPLQQPTLDTPVPPWVRLMEWTLPFCRHRPAMTDCQDDAPLARFPDDEGGELFRLRQELEAAQGAANARASRVPGQILAGVQRMTPQRLQTMKAERGPGCNQDLTERQLQIVSLSRPVFSIDGQWAMISVVSGSCFDGFGLREKFLLHREDNRWVFERPDRGGGVRSSPGRWPYTW
ncbi:hypothetical protein C1922_12120 [Stenotrophomonas sp. ZAC14D2_NAIMI4_7]|uniref:hypothetical protein n=1 Tax=Stenotrophomonas sp. ZAC14D2_NAIMI4_7 TaxID=2072405 RepID=UPI000D53EDB8|nr:hypothetical protein [Stenotrophomonas sp. ZAC14D2_NAIMI4_7]AWH17990.1 hypothetical protein C1922_12120 [Stenotrophomonas sp. ZAC14D2_NAIMI4_7]